MIEGPPEFIVMVFLATFATSEYNSQKAAQARDSAEAEDELAKEEREHYREQVSK